MEKEKDVQETTDLVEAISRLLVSVILNKGKGALRIIWGNIGGIFEAVSGAEKIPEETKDLDREEIESMALAVVESVKQDLIDAGKWDPERAELIRDAVKFQIAAITVAAKALK